MNQRAQRKLTTFWWNTISAIETITEQSDKDPDYLPDDVREELLSQARELVYTLSK